MREAIVDGTLNPWVGLDRREMWPLAFCLGRYCVRHMNSICIIIEVMSFIGVDGCEDRELGVKGDLLFRRGEYEYDLLISQTKMWVLDFIEK